MWREGQFSLGTGPHTLALQVVSGDYVVGYFQLFLSSAPALTAAVTAVNTAGVALQRSSQRLNRQTVPTVLEETADVLCGYSRDRLTHRFNQCLAVASFSFP